MGEKEYEGIPRNKIPWDPTIDPNKCLACEKCVNFCHMKAFKTQQKNEAGKKKIIVNKNRCVVFCRGCEEICPAGAISHPNEEETQKIIDALHSKKGQDA